MHENSETSLYSAKAAMELSQKKADDAKKKEAATNKIFQLASEQVALLKKSNQLAIKHILKRKRQELAVGQFCALESLCYVLVNDRK